MISQLTRRRFFCITAAVCATSGTHLVASTPVANWWGTALGTYASAQIAGVSAEEAGPVFAASECELNRSEAIFSYNRQVFEFARLNATGHISAPTAVVADGLSTAICVPPCDRHSEAILEFPGASLSLTV